MSGQVDPRVIDALHGYDSPTVANAIESLDVRLRNEGFADASIRCLTKEAQLPLVGYAVTVRIRCSNPPKDGHPYVDRTDWWSCFQTLPQPRVVVVQDVDEKPGTGAFMGAVHASILERLGCAGVITNGAVRDLPALQEGSLQVFAGSVSVSHAYAHIVDFGQPVELGGLTIHSGDLLHADQHGVLSIPHAVAAEIPTAADAVRARDQRVIELCRSPEFSIEKLRDAVAGIFH